MKIKKTLTLPGDDVEWYELAYPGFEMSAMMTLLLHSFRQEHETIGLTPINAAQNAAKELKGQIREGIIEGVREFIENKQG